MKTHPENSLPKEFSQWKLNMDFKTVTVVVTYLFAFEHNEHLNDNKRKLVNVCHTQEAVKRNANVAPHKGLRIFQADNNETNNSQTKLCSCPNTFGLAWASCCVNIMASIPMQRQGGERTEEKRNKKFILQLLWPA